MLDFKSTKMNSYLEAGKANDDYSRRFIRSALAITKGTLS